MNSTARLSTKMPSLSWLCLTSNNGDEVDALVSIGADVNATDGYNSTALHLASKFNPSTEITNALIRNGADIEAKDVLGKTPLEYAILHGNNNVVKELYDLGAKHPGCTDCEEKPCSCGGDFYE